MSSTSFRKPEFRLYLGYPDVRLSRADAGTTIGMVAPGAPEFGAALRRFASEVARARGRLDVVLPEAEVWRGRLDLAGVRRQARRRAAREAAAAALGMRADGVAVVMGTPEAGGRTPVAAVRRDTLAETRTLLAGSGLRPSAIVGDGAFAGFATPPRFGGRRWQRPAMTPSRRAAAMTLGVGAAALAALFLSLAGQPPEVPPVAAAVTQPEPPVAPSPVAQTAPPAELRPRAAPPLRLLRSDPPLARPKAVAEVPAEPVVTVATRSVPILFMEPRRGPLPELRLAELSTARVRTIDLTVTTPLRRPAALPAPALDIARTAVIDPALMPRKRPSEAAPERPAVATPPQEAAGRPRPRPGPAAQPLVVAALSPAAATVGLAAAAAVAAPPARPAGHHIAPSAPRAVAKAAPTVVRPATPKPPTQAALPVRTVAAAARPEPAPVRQRVVVVKKPPVAPPKPTVVVQKAPQPAPVVLAKATPVSAAPAAATTQKVGLSRGSVSLIGVFGGASERHALLRMPNGSVQRVRPGDSVQGAQVADVGSDSVRLRGGGRDTLLRLPD